MEERARTMHDCLYFPKVSKNMLNLIFFFNYKVQKKKKAHKENKRVKGLFSLSA